MRIAVLGIGDVGSHYGGALVLAGEDVTFLVRSVRLDAVRAEGLTLSRESLNTILAQEVMDRLEDSDLTLPVEVTDDPEEVGPVDLLLFCVKTYDEPRRPCSCPTPTASWRTGSYSAVRWSGKYGVTNRT